MVTPVDAEVSPRQRLGADSFDAPLWRALAVFRIAALAYALILIFHNAGVYQHPVAAWVVAGVMTAWTAASIKLYAQPSTQPSAHVRADSHRIGTSRLDTRRLDTRRVDGNRPSARGWPLLIADLGIMSGCLLASVPIIGIGSLGTTRTLPGIAVAGPVMAWAVSSGRRGGTIAAVLIGAADLSTRGAINQNTLNSDVLLLLAAIAIGHVSRLGMAAQERMAQAVKLEAATRTRERLARDIHDSVLQVLALVARRAQQLGGEAAELGQLAGEQEAALRTLIGTTEASRSSDGRVDGLADLRTSLDLFASATVTVSGPASAVNLPEYVHHEIVAAVASALDNVARHAGESARAWVLLEEDQGAVMVTVRDDGAGFAADRLDAAAAAGRLGVAQSINGRMRDAGGTANISSRPGQGTEVELHLPRQATKPPTS